jgi:hypothetical protein
VYERTRIILSKMSEVSRLDWHCRMDLQLARLDYSGDFGEIVARGSWHAARGIAVQLKMSAVRGRGREASTANKIVE